MHLAARHVNTGGNAAADARMIRKTDTKNNETLSVPMNDRALEILKKRAALFPDSQYPFPHAAGEHAGEAIRDLKRSFHTALEKSGISNFRWHDLRHTLASRLAMGGVDLVSIQKLLGHKSLRMTSRYAHVSDEHLSKQVKVLDKVLPKSRPSGAPEPGKQQQLKARRTKKRQKQKMHRFNELAGRRIRRQAQANPGRTILPCFATMGSGVRTPSGPPANFHQPRQSALHSARRGAAQNHFTC